MSYYGQDYLNGVLENKDSNAIDQGWFGTVMGEEFTNESYAAGADFLEGKLDFEDVEFTSFVLSETFDSSGRWSAANRLFPIFNIDDYNEDEVYSKASTLMKYAEEIGLPDDWEEKLEKATLLDNFKQNFSKINVSQDHRMLNTDRVLEIIAQQDYDVYNTDQVQTLSELVYYMTNDKRPDMISAGVYDSTRQWNQLAINADMDEDVLKAIESGASGWYAEDIEEQFDKVDMQDFTRDQKRAHAKHMAENRITQEMVDKWNEEYKGVLTFDYRKGFTGLENQVNDYIEIKFDGDVIYSDEGKGNDFGSTSLDSAPIKNLLDKNDYKAVSDVFLF